MSVSSILTISSQGYQKSKRQQGIKTYLKKIMMENFPNLVKEIGIEAQEVQRVPNKMNPKRPTPRHSIIKMPKFQDKERILKAAREKHLVTYKRVPIRLSVDFSIETLQARRGWHKIFKMIKRKDLQPRLFYSDKN
uniref:Uncharacterized protein n=1 Tax=Rousettus aegyptiacus TaxID=9407 RepID=A0A7J8F0N7_ROUAE|nr:hypothetical protein HJG63_012366 [Rousettus aegyptiacus]